MRDPGKSLLAFLQPMLHGGSQALLGDLHTMTASLNERRLPPELFDPEAKVIDALGESLKSISANFGVTILGRRWDAPFGVAPIGLGGLVWPRAAEHLAASARRHNLPFVMSSYATVGMERVVEIAPEHAWFQLYAFNLPDMDRAIVTRAERAGFEVLVVTVDLPTATRRAHDVRNGLSVPPRMDLGNLLQMMARPPPYVKQASPREPRGTRAYTVVERRRQLRARLRQRNSTTATAAARSSNDGCGRVVGTSARCCGTGAAVTRGVTLTDRSRKARPGANWRLEEPRHPRVRGPRRSTTRCVTV